MLIYVSLEKRKKKSVFKTGDLNSAVNILLTKLQLERPSFVTNHVLLVKAGIK